MAAKILGIDEAGRGAVVGPLVICGALISESKLDKLKELGVRDSKLLTPKRRTELSSEINKVLNAHCLVRILAREIDLNRQSGMNLNEQEIQKMAFIINELKPDKVYIDALEANIRTFNSKLKIHLRVDPEIISKHKADSIYPIVSAASILAKVTRDKEITKLKREYGELGSGYPADEVTKKFLSNWLKANKELPPIVRKSWSTVSGALGAKKQKKLQEFE